MTRCHLGDGAMIKIIVNVLRRVTELWSLRHYLYMPGHPILVQYKSPLT